MNKFVVACSVFLSVIIHAQVSFNSWTYGFLQINSYNGNTNPDAYTITFSGNGNINIPRWKVSVKLKQSVKSENGNFTIPSNKISLQPISSTGQSYPNPIPSISDIGAPLNVFLQDNMEVFLIPRSNSPLYNAPVQPQAYYNLQLKYAITLSGGSYLGSYPAWTTFIVPLEFTAYDQNNAVIGKTSQNFQFQIGNITDSPPVSDEMSLKINMNAANGLLEFKSMQDYNNGASVTYANALSIKSSTNYQVRVRSLQNDLISRTGNTIPISVVHLTLIPISQGKQSIFPVVLSALDQTLARGSINHITSSSYDVKYFTSPQDERLINAKPDDYSTTLQYEITPQ